MKLILALALLLPAFPAGAAAPEAHPDLVRLEQDLTRKQDDKKESRITAEEYREWESGFRSLLAAAEASVPPSPENTAARARIAALLGERDRAGASLARALEENPDSAVLLRTKGQLLYESKDYPGAAEHGLQAWEKSGRTDTAALALYQSAKGRGAPAGGGTAAPSGGPAAASGPPVVSAADSSRPYKLPVKGGAKIAEVPSLTADAVPADGGGNELGLLTTLGIGAGVLLIAWGAVPQETKDHFKQVLWEQPKQELKAAAVATAVIGAVYLGATVLPPLLTTMAPSAPALTPALAGGGTAGGGVVLEQAAVGAVKAGGTAIVLRKALDQFSYSKSESTGDKGIPEAGRSQPSLENPESLRGVDSREVENLIPKDWVKGPMKKGAGTRYLNPKKPGESVLVENGWPGANDPLHRGPYLRISRNGQIIRIPLKGNPSLP